jgi:hypothetical protein
MTDLFRGAAAAEERVVGTKVEITDAHILYKRIVYGQEKQAGSLGPADG